MPKSVPPVDDAPLTDLAVGVAHDMRNVLFVVTAHCNRLLKTVDHHDPRLDDVLAIREAADRGIALARHLLSTARQHTAAPRPIDVNHVIRGAEPLLRRLVGSGIEIALRLGPHLWPVTANATQIEQVVMNLVINARDAMPAGGRVVISTENRCVALAGSAQPCHQVVISVSDTGTGIDPAVQARMFEPDFTTKGATGGTGIGLATVHAIARLNGGHVEVCSVPDEGATLHVVLPRGDAAVRSDESLPEMAMALEPAPDAETSRERANGKRILLVDDEPSVRELLYRCLLAEGYELLVAATGREAIEMSKSAQPPLDLVVTDLNLPDMKGSEIARRLRVGQPNLGVVYMSGELDPPRDLSHPVEAPVLTKPFAITDLTRLVRTVLAA